MNTRMICYVETRHRLRVTLRYDVIKTELVRFCYYVINN